MEDINTKVLQNVPLKQQGYEPPQPPAGPGSPEQVQKEREQIGSSDSAGLSPDSGGKERGEAHSYTVMICCGGNETRVVSMKAGSAEEAKAIASAGLENGESVSSVNESTVSIPDPDRGLIA